MDNRREDDSFARKIIAGLLIALAMETFGGLYFYGKLVDRVEQLEKEVASFAILTDTMRSIDKTLTRLDTKVDYLTKKLDNTGAIVDRISGEQERRTSIVYDSKEHMKNRTIHGTK